MPEEPPETSSAHGTTRHGGALLVVADTADVTGPARVLETLGETRIVCSRDAPAVLAALDVAVVIADCDGGSGRRVLAEAAAVRPCAVRILLGSADGPSDGTPAAVLPKPVDPQALRALCALGLRYAAAQRTARDLEDENSRLRGIETETATRTLDELDGVERYEGILTRSPAMKRVLELIDKIADSDTTVLVHGETGTGKELVAQAIHARSRRPKRRFVAVNLGAISDHLRESELFGHLRGAFTGATDSRGGLFAEADGGSIFLD